MDILLSVIVPVYNVQDYLVKCIESIINQSYHNLEIILVDDGSTDCSGRICDEYAKNDKRIHVIHKCNGGLVSARKAGAMVATGDYIINVDGDDWIDLDRFEKLVLRGLKDFPDMSYMDGYYKEYLDETLLIKYDIGERIFENSPDELLQYFTGDTLFLERRIVTSQWSWCVKREIYLNNQLKINNAIQMAEDVIMVFSCTLDSKKIVCIDEAGYHYVQRKGSIVNRESKWEETHAIVFYNQMKDLINRHVESEAVLNVAVQYIYHNLIMTNYDKLYNFYIDYMFPYEKVINGSNIVIYGGGLVGNAMVNAIENDSRHKIVAWVDKKHKENSKSKYRVEELSVINERNFDYIVVAILASQTARKVKQDLFDMGVNEGKVVLMDSRLMNMGDLDKMLG
jgi:glycosyltransferase involved in cell wall biosynthesis